MTERKVEQIFVSQMDKSSKMTTMAEVAAAAGVSKMAVSLALRGSSRVSESTRLRILEVADRMHYRPNPMVQTLMANLRATRPVEMHSAIAWVTAFDSQDGWADHWVYREYYKGAEQRALELGYRIEPFWAFAEGMNGARLSDVLCARGIGGVIIPPVPNPATEIDLEWQHFASATIGYSFLKPKLHRAAANLDDGMTMALRHCEAAGYQRIGFVTPEDTDKRANHTWLSVFLAWQRFQPKKRVVPMLYVEEGTPIENELGPWLEKHRPDVIIGPNIEFIEWLPELFGLQIPEDIGYVSLSKPIKHVYSTRITGINQQDADVGACAVDLVVAQLQRNELGLSNNPKVVLSHGVWERGTTLVESDTDLESRESDDQVSITSD